MPGPAFAAEMGAPSYTQRYSVAKPRPKVWRYNAPGAEAPFARSPRAQSVWDSDLCWRQCGAYCAWGMNECLQVDDQGLCVAYTDACDRYCQVACRRLAGPFVPIE